MSRSLNAVLSSLGVLIGILILAQWVSFIAWFLPAALALVIGVQLKSAWRDFMPVFGVGLLLTGLWAAFLVRYGDAFPRPLQALLAIALQPQPGIPEAGRFDPGPWSGADLLGYTYLASVTGAMFILYWAALTGTARIQRPQVRVWAFRIAVLAAAAGGTWLSWYLKTGLHVAFGFVAYFFAAGVLFTKVDPLDELRD